MKLHASGPSGVNTITGYGEGYVTVNSERRTSSVVVLPDRIEPWGTASFDALSADDFRFLGELPIGHAILRLSPRKHYLEAAPIHFVTEPASLGQVTDGHLSSWATWR